MEHTVSLSFIANMNSFSASRELNGRIAFKHSLQYQVVFLLSISSLSIGSIDTHFKWIFFRQTRQIILLACCTTLWEQIGQLSIFIDEQQISWLIDDGWWLIDGWLTSENFRLSRLRHSIGNSQVKWCTWTYTIIQFLLCKILATCRLLHFLDFPAISNFG